MATSIKLNLDWKNRVEALAEIQKRSVHWIMLHAIQEYVLREEAREAFKQEALASWEAFQETGRHLTGAEVGEWLKTWGSKKKKALPPCHA